MRRQWEVLLYLGLGTLFGLSIAAYRHGRSEADAYPPAHGQNQVPLPIISSPPGTFTGGTVVPAPHEPPFKGKIGRTISESISDWPPIATAPKDAPNVLFIVLDDVGFASLECYGSPVLKTPHLDKLAAGGLRYNNFHTAALCSPSRACILTGRNHHSNSMGVVAENSNGFPGYTCRMPLSNGMLSEMLTPFGWAAFAIGKWHLLPVEDMSLAANRKWWPLGRGFDRFYGFLGAEADQWYPWLTYDNHFVKPPKTPELGYHCMADLVDKTKEFIADLKQVAPDRPFFAYFCPGAMHAPHQVSQEWIARYKGKFDAGWDDYREKCLANQLKLGICPPGTKLSPRNAEVPEWATLPREEKELLAREMEVFAGFLTYVDDQIGQLLAFLEEMGQLDNTLIVAISDNGSSHEGGPNGSFNESLFFNNVQPTVAENLKHLKNWGGPNTYPHFSWGWAWATNTPFRRWKREVARGGITDLCIVHWPRGIKAKGEIRHQFIHAIDLVPTVLDVLKVKMPLAINGVTQSPIEGVSFAATFGDAKAKVPREAQYFEMFGTRSIYLDGWQAYAPWETFGKQITPTDFDNAKWMLFHIDEDFSESTDVAAKYPKKLEEMKQMWLVQASKYKVLPIDASSMRRLKIARPDIAGPRSKYTYYQGTGEVESSTAVDLRNRSFTITADVEIPKGGAEGVLLSHGGMPGGYTFFVKDGKLQYAYNYVGIEEYRVVSTANVPTGKVELKVQFQVTIKPDFAKGRGQGGLATLFINGQKAGEGKIAMTAPYTFTLSGEGMCCGRDSGTPVTPAYRAEFPFTATIRRVVVDIGDDQPPMPGPIPRGD